MKKSVKSILFSLIIISICMSCAKTSHKDSKLIGVILPFSSAFSDIANEQKDAIDLVMKEYDDYKIVYEDSGNDKEGAVKAFNRLLTLEKPPYAIISCASWVATAIHPLAAEADIFHIVIGSASFKRSHSRHTVRLTLDTSQEEKQLANYLQQYKRIAIFYMDNSLGIGWKDTLKRNMADKIVEAIAYDPGKDNFKSDLIKIKESAPEALVLLSAGEAGIIARQSRELGITAQFVGTRPIERPELLEEAEYTNGLIYTYPSYDRNHPVIDQFTEVNGFPPTYFGLEAYDSITSLLLASQAGNFKSEDLFDWYAGNTFHGALGEVRFDDIGDAHYPYMYKEISNGEFKTASFQYELLLENAREEIMAIFNQMNDLIAVTAEKLSQTGLTGEDSDKELQELFNQLTYVYDIVTIDTDGIIRNVYPSIYSEVLAADISDQPQIVEMHKTLKPTVSEAIETVEGFIGFTLDHPIFNDKNEFIGAVSILMQPEFFGEVISQKISNFPIEIWIMQKDGTVIYDHNEEEIGLNIFSDELYSDYPELINLAKEMSYKQTGSGEYSFLDQKFGNNVIKKLIWTTITLHNTELRLALSHLKEDF